jgi:tetratricopeptide (TPR) repeat protein
LLLTSSLGLFMAGCALPPSGEDDRTNPIAVPAPRPSFTALELAEHALRLRAEAYLRDGRLADVLVQWEILALLRPESQEYRDEIERVSRQIREDVSALLRSASEARRRGQVQQAIAQYLRVLSLDRSNAAAADALREIERERTRRAYINRPPRFFPAQ